MCIVKSSKTHTDRAWNEAPPHSSRYTAHPRQTGTAVARLPPITYREGGNPRSSREEESRRRSHDSHRSGQHGHHHHHHHHRSSSGGHGRTSSGSLERLPDERVVVKRKVFYE